MIKSIAVVMDNFDEVSEMKQVYYIRLFKKIKFSYLLAVLLLFIACKNENGKTLTRNNDSEASTQFIDTDSSFNQWLLKLGVERNMIKDTTKERAFELWSYTDKLTKFDSSYYWYPSTDSSYFLITNFNLESKNRINLEFRNDISLRFHKSESEEVYLGLWLLDSLKQRSIDFFWYDSTTFYYSEKPEGKNEISLTKLKMGIDSVWRFSAVN